jgi:hypothetical protein
MRNTKYGSLVCILIILINAAFFGARAVRLAGDDAERLGEYQLVIRGFVLYFGGWLIAHCVGVFGGLVSAYDTTARRGAGIRPYDWFLFALALVINARFARWMFQENGDELLARCRGIFNWFPESSEAIRNSTAVLMTAILVGSVSLLWRARAQRS